MSGAYRSRVGQWVGDLEVLADHGRTKSGKVLWKVLDHATGRELHLKTYELIRLAKAADVPAPPLTVET